jgi:hypothetical protein
VKAVDDKSLPLGMCVKFRMKAQIQEGGGGGVVSFYEECYFIKKKDKLDIRNEIQHIILCLMEH